NWNTVNNGLSNLYVNTFALGGTSLFAGTRLGLFRSIDNGKGWAVDSGLTSLDVIALAVSGTNLLAATDSGLFRSINGGATWATVSKRVIFRLLLSGTSLFASCRGCDVGCCGGSLSRSTDDGTSWTDIVEGLPNPNVS